MPNYGTIPSTPTRFPGGLNTSWVTDTTAMMGQLDPSKFATDFDDFFIYLATDWTITTTGTGTRALGAGAGGWLVVTNSAADDDANFYQRTVAAFQPVANKRTFFKMRCKLSEVIQSDFQAGLIITDTTPFDATDGIYFLKPDGSANLGVFVRKDATTGSTSNTNIATLVADTFFTCGFHYNGKDEVEFFVDDVKLAVLDATSTYLPDTLLALSFGVQNGEAVAKILTVDYVMAAQER